MSVHTNSRLIHAPQEKVFELIADVEKYPDFLPIWIEARIYRRQGSTYYTKQKIGLGPIRQGFRTKTELTPPARIEVTSSDTLFRKFFIHWDLESVGRDCRVGITLSWEVRSYLMQKAIDLVLPETARSMVLAFERRADRVGA